MVRAKQAAIDRRDELHLVVGHDSGCGPLCTMMNNVRIAVTEQIVAQAEPKISNITTSSPHPKSRRHLHYQKATDFRVRVSTCSALSLHVTFRNSCSAL